jgi:hypothetical protein
LTCRANHRHNAIIAKIAKARTEKSVAGFLFGILESDGGRTSTPQLPTPPAGRRERAVVRAFTQLAGMREHAGLRRGSSPPHAAPDGIRFAPQMICACTAIMPHVSFWRDADDRLPDLACADRPRCHRRFGGGLVSAEIIQFIPRPERDDAPTDFPTIAFRPAVQDPVVAHADADADQPDEPERRGTKRGQDSR